MLSDTQDLHHLVVALMFTAGHDLHISATVESEESARLEWLVHNNVVAAWRSLTRHTHFSKLPRHSPHCVKPSSRRQFLSFFFDVLSVTSRCLLVSLSVPLVFMMLLPT